MSLLSRHLAITHCRKLYQSFNIFEYLKLHPNSKLVMNLERMYLGRRFKVCFKDNAYWFKFYGDVKEEIPVDTIVTYGKDVDINTWFDADHAGDCLTCHRHM